MPPNIQEDSLIAEAVQTESAPQSKVNPVSEPEKYYKWDVIWFNVLFLLLIHLGGLYGAFLLITQFHVRTVLFYVLFSGAGALGTTAGSHRLWTHRSYKAKLPLRILLAFMQTFCFQNHIYEWVRDHRMHHKYTDTDADPHNAKRGFFFSHVGWLLVKKHKDVKEKGKKKIIYMKDLEDDSVVMFQKKYYMILMPLICFILPPFVPWYFFGEDLISSWFLSILRYDYSLHATWAVNSLAHLYGTQPYDKNIMARQNSFVAHATLGEGWHNYHHVFPWDYKTSEFSGYGGNVTTGFIDMFAKIGWAYDLKSVPEEIVKKRIARTGGGSGKNQRGDEEEKSEMIWGWGDQDMSEQEKTDIITYNDSKKD